jgi:glycosyltransferase involved in cell wall biosynthesis
MSRRRVLYLVHHFPQISETYIRTEIEAVGTECDVRVIALHQADYAHKNHVPYQVTEDPNVIREQIEEFRPDVLHCHWLDQVPTLAYFAGCCGSSPTRCQTPFTVRAHSFDTLGADEEFLKSLTPILNGDLCLGVLAFPFSRPILERAGIRAAKLIDCYPVVHYDRFHDPSPNGTGVMNMGACLPKKQMEDFLELAARFPQRRFNLYAMGYKVDDITRRKKRSGSPVHIVPPVEPEDMAAEYKKHEWLVYTAARDPNTVGWPMAVAEAQAAGLGVCMPNLRPDLHEYVGPGGYLYDSLEQVADIISRPYPEEKRQAGFEQARKSDVFRHRKLLLDLWHKTVATSPSAPVPVHGDTAVFAAWEWRERHHAAMRDLAAHVPAGESCLLVDDGVFGTLSAGPRLAPFPQVNGAYAGPPADDASAIRELVRLRENGAHYLAIGFPAFWWLEHYPGFQEYLNASCRLLLKNERIILVDLR